MASQTPIFDKLAEEMALYNKYIKELYSPEIWFEDDETVLLSKLPKTSEDTAYSFKHLTEALPKRTPRAFSFFQTDEE